VVHSKTHDKLFIKQKLGKMKVTNPPMASALMKTARSFGSYDLAAALADLVDNSIQARAGCVTINVSPHDDEVTVRVRDDGRGMTCERLIAAMQPASADPELVRDASDLGRFGWGLKSASLSQARVLTVVSWTTDGISAARWDIDDIADWAMDLFEGPEAMSLLTLAPETACGTEVIWTRCDRLLDEGLGATLDERLNDKIASAKRQLALIFHRYLAGDDVARLRILFQGAELTPSDPFMSAHPATQTLDEERIRMKGGLEIAVKPYVVPHFSKLTVQEKEALGGDEGLVRNQGFYVYRNRRLIIHGTWFRLVPHGELSQLTRIRVDLPNGLDAEWKITLDKSGAQLPAALRNRLREVVRRFNLRSSGVQRRRGINLDPTAREPVWTRIAQSGRIRYYINRDHPIVDAMLSEADDSLVALEALKLIEAYVPVDGLISDSSSTALSVVQPITDPDEYEPLVTACFLACTRRLSKTPSLTEFLSFAKAMEPFASQWIYTESLVRARAVETWSLRDD